MSRHKGPRKLTPDEKAAMQDRFRRWCATNEKDRLPPTITELAEEMGVTVRCLQKWRTEGEFKKTVTVEQVERKQERTGEVLDRLFEQTKEKPEACKTWLTYFDKKNQEQNPYMDKTEFELYRLLRDKMGMLEKLSDTDSKRYEETIDKYGAEIDPSIALAGEMEIEEIAESAEGENSIV